MNSTASKRSRKNNLPVLIAAFVALSAASTAPARENLLANNPSPYLALHGTDPVQWQPWGRPALEAAKRAYGLRDEEYLRLKILTLMLPQI